MPPRGAGFESPVVVEVSFFWNFVLHNLGVAEDVLLQDPQPPLHPIPPGASGGGGTPWVGVAGEGGVSDCRRGIAVPRAAWPGGAEAPRRWWP